jgi:hypothetical protein
VGRALVRAAVGHEHCDGGARSTRLAPERKLALRRIDDNGLSDAASALVAPGSMSPARRRVDHPHQADPQRVDRQTNRLRVREQKSALLLMLWTALHPGSSVSCDG